VTRYAGVGLRALPAYANGCGARAHPKITACQCMMSSSLGAAVRQGGGSFKIFLKSRIRRFRAGFKPADDLDIGARVRGEVVGVRVCSSLLEF